MRGATAQGVVSNHYNFAKPENQDLGEKSGKEEMLHKGHGNHKSNKNIPLFQSEIQPQNQSIAVIRTT